MTTAAPQNATDSVIDAIVQVWIEDGWAVAHRSPQTITLVAHERHVFSTQIDTKKVKATAVLTFDGERVHAKLLRYWTTGGLYIHRFKRNVKTVRAMGLA